MSRTIPDRKYGGPIYATQRDIENLRQNITLLAKVVREQGDVIKVIVAALQPTAEESTATAVAESESAAPSDEGADSAAVEAAQRDIDFPSVIVP